MTMRSVLCGMKSIYSLDIYIYIPVQGGMAEMSRRANARIVLCEGLMLLLALSQAPLRHWFVFIVRPALISHTAGARPSGTFSFCPSLACLSDLKAFRSHPLPQTTSRDLRHGSTHTCNYVFT